MTPITSSDIRWIRSALLQAEQAPHAQWRVGSVLVRGGSVLSTGFNRYRNDPAQVELSGVSYHAEAVVLRRTSAARGATLYVARVRRNGSLGASKPCARCQAALVAAGVHTVVWTTPYGLQKARVTLAKCTVGHLEHSIPI